MISQRLTGAGHCHFTHYLSEQFMIFPFNDAQSAKLIALATALVDQDAARVMVPPNANRHGFWFGGGNLCETPGGRLLLTGRYRNAGDSRTGLEQGERGLELAIFESTDGGKTFSKLLSFDKQRLGLPGGEVISIEGTHLVLGPSQVDLYVSTEKSRHYPAGLEAYQKPGTGIWSIDRLSAPTLEALADAPVQPLLSADQPEFLHVKDPWVETSVDNETRLFCCTHPFCWSSSNSALCLAAPDGFGALNTQVLPRGETWDVAVTRLTGSLLVPPVGIFQGLAPLRLYFYDGAEGMHPMTSNSDGRPRGYSCEEIGGLAVAWEAQPGQAPNLVRLSRNFPLFTSPHGTGCCRYVKASALNGGLWAVWQQSQPDGSQPLVGHHLPMDRVRTILSD